METSKRVDRYREAWDAFRVTSEDNWVYGGVVTAQNGTGTRFVVAWSKVPWRAKGAGVIGGPRLVSVLEPVRRCYPLSSGLVHVDYVDEKFGPFSDGDLAGVTQTIAYALGWEAVG